ncbi:Spy/CpxP family protein refolding chaperone [Duganella phyllosphaerae]|uniref:Periplasmic protein n=1 Tax=Duganella phyllosphaerae TaxID=762836 RepID=A0A1E7X754_9BURK|nr:Spy/CpxP family protein refolding chaperone [Duganella phyllosphaerae]OFA08957.1 hypothetical protein DUPY_03290 [Duganella phyllosphaerae]
MNIIRKSILIGFTVLGMAAAQAQDAAPQTKPEHSQRATPEQRQAKMEEMYAKRQARLHDQLKLTAQQESAWAAYQAAIKPAARTGARPPRGEFAKLSSPERLSKMIERTKMREDKMQQHLTAMTAFYNQLTPEQKAAFDQHSMRGKHGGWGGHRGWGGQRGQDVKRG